MEGKQRNYNRQLEINDLIGNAVNNALVRRNQAIDSQDTLSILPNEEAAKIAGGIIARCVMGYLAN